MQQRPPGIYINLGNLLELLGAVAFCEGIDRLLGLAWALIAAGILLVAAAELIYDSTAIRALPLPSRWPAPRARILTAWQRWQQRRAMRRALRASA